MRSTKQRSSLLQLLAVFGSFVGGPILGLWLASHFAPESALAQFVGGFAFLLAFVGGLALWFGLGVFQLLRASWRRRSEGTAVRKRSIGVDVPPGYRAFLVLGLVCPASAGTLVGALSSAGVILCAAAFALVGLAFGTTLWSLAHYGFLPFPEPE